MDNVYHIFGLNITSFIPLPALPVLHPQPDAASDVLIEYGKAPDALTNSHSKGVCYQAAPGEFLLRVDHVARYHVQNGNHITIMPETGTGNDDILVFLMGSAIGALLRRRNTLALHAGARAVGRESSVIFCGPSGVGKSTLVAGFHQGGYPFLADDVCAVMTYNGRPAVIPGFPRLKVWADVLKKMNVDKDEFKAVRGGKGPDLSLKRATSSSAPSSPPSKGTDGLSGPSSLKGASSRST